MLFPASSRRAIWAAGGRCILIVVGLGILYALAPMHGDHPWLGALIALVGLALVGPLTIQRARRVLRSEQPVLDAVEAIVLLVSILVFAFSIVYLTIDRNGDQFNALQTHTDAMYFTVVTLSTVGYGDITATGQAARVAVIIQIVFDFAMVAVAFRLLSAAAKHRLVGKGELPPGS
jgi:hypothetical protein